ncbi:MAG: S41 family peptidase [PVC group bacterium]|nr:S41 family peptidase [PVC group bacterium]
MLRKKISLLFILIFCITLCLNNTVIAKTDTDPKEDLYTQIELFSDVIASIQHDYVEDVKSKDIIYGALKGMLATLDPYSQFMDPDMYKELRVETEGEFGGLGIEITIKDNLLTIITPLDGTPADQVGLHAMDRIVKIEGEITRDITLTEAVKKMRGKPGTNVTLTIMRESEDELKDYTITRAIIEIKAIRKASILEDNIGYIKLVDFSEKTKENLDSALQELEEKGMDSLIFDLRNNPGGLLISSVETASKFLPTGDLIVYTKGRYKEQDLEYRSTGKSPFKNIPLIVLINGGSASASEIVAGAIQDNKRGIIVGSQSFGKGSVQTVIPLRDGSALRLTTAKYYTPSGKTINEEGVTPDVVVKREVPSKKTNEKDTNIFDKIDEKKEEKKDKEQNEKEKKEKEFIENDNQLRAAINLMHGIKIYDSMKKTN